MSASLVLGTAQLGMSYGVSNTRGQPSAEEGQRLLARARQLGIEALDTAQDYGEAEARIGQYQKRPGAKPFRVVTKISARVDIRDGAAVQASLEDSIQRLGCVPETVLLHNAAAGLGWSSTMERTLQKMMKLGLCKTWGISVYGPADLEAILPIEVLEVVQIPFNVLDRRLLDNDLYARASSKGKRLMIRSVFLQGLLLLQAEKLPPRMHFAQSAIAAWNKLCEAETVEPMLGALAYLRERLPDSDLVIGCESAEQMEMIHRHFQAAADKMPGWSQSVDRLAASAQVLDPRLWPPGNL